MLLKQPGFHAVAVLTLALGIGANSSIFSFVKGALLDALPYREAERLVVVWQDYRQRGGPEREWFSYPNFVDYRTRNRTLTDLAIFQESTFTVTGDQEPEGVTGQLVSPSMFDLLGVRPVHGRLLLDEDAVPGAAPVVILAGDFWRRRYAGDAGVIGRMISIDGRPYTVVGVLPPEFYAPLAPDVDLFMPQPPPPPAEGARRELVYRAIGRLKPEVTLSQARSDLSSVAAQITRDYPEAARDVGAAVYPLRDEMMGQAVPALLVLFTTAGAALLIACVNVANLLLARAAARRGEVALRSALGADRRRLARQMVSESLLLALLGGALGVAIAMAGVELLKQLAVSASFPLPNVEAVEVDGGVLAFTLLLSLITGLLFGLVPALVAGRTDLTRMLKDGPGISGGGRSTTLRTANLLVIGETALAIVLLVASGLMLRSLEKLQRVDFGYRPSGLLAFKLETPDSRYPETQQVQAFYNDLLARLEGLPGVVSAGAVSTLPLSGDDTDSRLRIEGRSEPAEGVPLWYRIVTPGYLETSGLTLLKGRGIEEQDREDAPFVAVINQAAARQYFPGVDPIGQALLSRQSRFTIVGVVGNGRVFSPRSEEDPAVYFSHGQITARSMGIVVRADRDPGQLARPVRRLLAGMDPNLTATHLAPLEDMIAAALAPERALGLLLSSLSLLALILAAVGLYGLMTHLTGQRTREVGIRMALGSNAATILRLVLGQALTLTLAGVTIGLLLSLAVTRVLQSLLFEVDALDPLSFAASAALLLLSTVLACYRPAWRASRVDPASVLRS